MGEERQAGLSRRELLTALGKRCDLAVLTDDYLTVPDEELRKVRSLLTLQGGRITHASGPFAGLAGG